MEKRNALSINDRVIKRNIIISLENSTGLINPRNL